ncbi:MAG: [FeFe] hydrogenase H-cluster maturation GTPase HydF [Deltaproteobacteria bacterium]|jgi:[FeFe] hydrogenase H-cluster maturation GTPase HydF|nr:[FeFe] hydrogenase H-cluster maturation GTPase HydF [Deltaproteobacteria bacterium]
MQMQPQPKAMSPHIGIYGRRNAGKSSLLNFLLGYELALVSAIAGTTADPVEKTLEVPRLGPVVFVDTAGYDDEGELGELRVQKTLASLKQVNLALLVSEGGWGEPEEEMVKLCDEKKLRLIVVWNKSDLARPPACLQEKLAGRGLPQVLVSTVNNTGLDDLVLAMLQILPEEALAPPPMLSDLIPAGESCLFVAPIDSSAPKGRLIAPQVQAMRDCLDGHLVSHIVQPQEIPAALEVLKKRPYLLVCDSQAVDECVRLAPPDLSLTTYSILMARIKGDLPFMSAGAATILGLKDGDAVCISEVCAHHAQPDDIGRVKIPNWLKKFTGADLKISFAQGRDYPADLSRYKLVIHCGGCMINRQLMLTRLAEAGRKGVPVTNYGVAISLLHGVLERSLQIFPAALEAYRKAAIEALARK